MRDGWQKLTLDWDRHKTHAKHIRCRNPFGTKPNLQYNRGILKTLKARSQKWNWFAKKKHIQIALSKLNVKKLEGIREGWGAKREHVEAITGCRQDRLAFGLPGASKLLSHQPSLFSQSNNPITSSSDCECETLRSFIMLLSLCISGWKRNKSVNLDSNSDSFAKTKGEIPDGDVMLSVERSTLRLGGVRRLLILLDCGDC